MKWFDGIVAALVPSDEGDMQAMRVYWLRLALVACSAWLAVVAFVIPALFVGLPMIGRVAWAGDVAKEVSQSVTPLRRELAEMKREIQAATAATNAALAEAIYQEILQLSRQRCAATDHRDRDRLSALIRARQLRYQHLSGDLTYSPPSCTDL